MELSITCKECPNTGRFHNNLSETVSLIKMGWRVQDGSFICPDCTKHFAPDDEDSERDTFFAISACIRAEKQRTEGRNI